MKKKELDKHYEEVKLKNAGGNPIEDFVRDLESILMQVKFSNTGIDVDSFIAHYGVLDNLKDWLEEQKDAADEYHQVLKEANDELGGNPYKHSEESIKNKLENFGIILSEHMENPEENPITKTNILVFEAIEKQVEELADKVWENI